MRKIYIAAFEDGARVDNNIKIVPFAIKRIKGKKDMEKRQAFHASSKRPLNCPKNEKGIMQKPIITEITRSESHEK